MRESRAGVKAISPLIAVSLSTCTYESSQNDLIILTEQTVILPGLLGWKWNRSRLRKGRVQHFPEIVSAQANSRCFLVSGLTTATVTSSPQAAVLPV